MLAPGEEPDAFGALIWQPSAAVPEPEAVALASDSVVAVKAGVVLESGMAVAGVAVAVEDGEAVPVAVGLLVAVGELVGDGVAGGQVVGLQTDPRGAGGITAR